ncbi:MAG: hypothetical protein KDI64_22540 [Candidatus Accumulibacter sp.]|nr:hypothetical protein [Accumulibacter sp.]
MASHAISKDGLAFEPAWLHSILIPFPLLGLLHYAFKQGTAGEEALREDGFLF